MDVGAAVGVFVEAAVVGVLVAPTGVGVAVAVFVGVLAGPAPPPPVPSFSVPNVVAQYQPYCEPDLKKRAIPICW